MPKSTCNNATSTASIVRSGLRSRLGMSRGNQDRSDGNPFSSLAHGDDPQENRENEETVWDFSGLKDANKVAEKTKAISLTVTKIEASSTEDNIDRPWTAVPFKKTPLRSTIVPNLTNSNWRSNTNGLKASTYQPARTGTNGYAARSTRIHRQARKLLNIDMAKMVPGAIVWRMDTRVCHDKKAISQGRDVWQRPDGVWMMTKGRWFIVVSGGRAHWVDVPIFTNDDRGLEAKPKELWHEFMTLRPQHVAPSAFTNKSPFYAPLEIKLMSDEFEKLRQSACVHVNEEQSHSFEDTEVRIVGVITPESLRRFVEVRDELRNRPTGR